MIERATSVALFSVTGLCTSTNYDKVIVNGKGEIVR